MKPLPLALLAASAPLGAEVLDFERLTVGSVPPGWEIAQTDGGAAPRWEIAVDSAAPAQGKVLAQLSDDRTSGRFPLAVFGGDEIVDGDVSVRFKPISGSVDQAAGLVWRYRDPNNYYVVRANALENNVVLYKVENGRRTPIGPVGREEDYGVEQAVPAQMWSTLGVTFVGSRFTVSFDGTELYAVEDATFASPGRVGIWTKADSVTYFDDFEVQAAAR